MKTKIFNEKKVKILAILPPLPPCPIKDYKRIKKRDIRKDSKPIKTKSYVQALSTNVNNILKIEENFLNLLWKKIKEVNRVIYNQKKIKPKINMTTNDPSYRQIIIPIDLKNSAKILSKSAEHITNINSALRSIKSYIIIDFIYSNHSGLIVITNNIVSALDLNTVKKYIKSVNSIQSEMFCLHVSHSLSFVWIS